ncbi:MAG: putative lipid flippase FtsW [Actinomycetota bacterium]
MTEPTPFIERIKARPQFWSLTLSAGFLLVVGLLLMSSASSVAGIRTGGSSFYFTIRQLQAITIGMVALGLIVRFINYRAMRVLASFWVLGTFALLIAVLLVGKTVAGQRNWIEFGPLQLQPSEMAKLAIPALIAWIVALANTHRWQDSTRWGAMVIGIVVMTAPVVLGRDLGNPLVMVAIGFVSIAIAEFPPKGLMMFAGAGIVGLAALLALGPSWKFERISGWLDPSSDPSGIGYQLLHGQYALATGGVFGNGIGSSIEKWGSLPAAHTDFILAVIAEETGLIGTLSLLVAMVVLILTSFQIGQQSRDIMGRLVGAGFGTWLGVQTVINVGGVTGMLPITGLPLPFVSYGGTSMIMMGVAIGILYVIEADNQELKELAEIDSMTVRQ